jgi:hypothetical protein
MILPSTKHKALVEQVGKENFEVDEYFLSIGEGD